MSQDIDETVQYIRNKLTPIRNIVLRLHSILIWQQPHHAPCISLVITVIFMTLWLVNAPIISKICFIGIIITLIDYFIPYLNAFLVIPKWEETEEQIFEDLCQNIAQTWLQLRDFYHLFSSWKQSKTKLYYTTLLTFLMVTAWIGSQINNFLLLYIITMFIVLYPGLKHHKLIDYGVTYLGTFITYKPTSSVKKIN